MIICLLHFNSVVTCSTLVMGLLAISIESSDSTRTSLSSNVGIQVSSHLN